MYFVSAKIRLLGWGYVAFIMLAASYYWKENVYLFSFILALKSESCSNVPPVATFR
jgi:hypothetical protein